MAFLTEAANRGSISTGYEISNSLLMDNSDTGMDFNHQQIYTGGDDQWTAKANEGTNTKKATISMWIKRSKLSPSSGSGQHMRLFHFITGGTATSLYLTNDKINMYDDSTSAYLISNRALRDTTAWYHIVLAMDSTQSTAANRVKIYINGVQETSWSNEDYGNQNAVLGMFSSANVTFILGSAGGHAQGYAFDGYITEFHFVDGAQKAASDFGEYDDSGIWKPIEYTGSHGILGCYYNFEDTSNNRFNDESGNDNYMDNRGGSFEGAITTDTPTNNFCTVRPMWTPHDAACSLLEGGTIWKINMPSGGGFQPNTSAISTFQFNSGKWYWETTWTNDGDRSTLGIVSSLSDIEQTVDPDRYIWWDGGHIPWNFSGSGSNDLNPPTYDSINTIGIALDMDNDRIAFSKDGGWLDSSGNTSDSSPGYFYSWAGTTFLSHAKANGNVAAFFGINTNSNTVAPTHNINFGGYAPTMRTSGGNSDANGYGNFAYSVPSGFYAACTKNVAEYGG